MTAYARNLRTFSNLLPEIRGLRQQLPEMLLNLLLPGQEVFGRSWTLDGLGYLRSVGPGWLWRGAVPSALCLPIICAIATKPSCSRSGHQELQVMCQRDFLPHLCTTILLSGPCFCGNRRGFLARSQQGSGYV